jgi:hypothetical protein
LDVLVEHWDDFVALGNWKGSARTEVILDVHYDQSCVAVDLYGQFSCVASWNS